MIIDRTVFGGENCHWLINFNPTKTSLTFFNVIKIYTNDTNVKFLKIRQIWSSINRREYNIEHIGWGYISKWVFIIFRRNGYIFNVTTRWKKQIFIFFEIFKEMFRENNVDRFHFCEKKNGFSDFFTLLTGITKIGSPCFFPTRLLTLH